MFSSLFFLIFAMVVISLGTDASQHLTWKTSPAEGFVEGLAAYGIVLFVIILQIKTHTKWALRNKEKLLFATHLLLLAFLICFYSVFGAQRLLQITAIGQFLNTLLSLSFYFGGIALFHYLTFTQRVLHPEAEIKNGFTYASHQIRLWLPFAVPFLALMLLMDVSPLDTFLQNSSPAIQALIMMSLFGIFMIVMLLFLPVLIQWAWGCKSIDDVDQWLAFQRICNKAKFYHTGLRTWTILNHALTASIIGIFPHFRYVMFTKRLLIELPQSSVEAILVHEIGHSQRRHLLILPFVIFGMFVIGALLYKIFTPLVVELPLFALLIPYLILFGLYFRYVFGYFSRLFERQADLHPFVIGTPPEDMIAALNEIGIVTGDTHRHWSWHHGSIHGRINALQYAIAHPDSIPKFHRHVRRRVIFYFLILAILLILLLI